MGGTRLEPSDPQLVERAGLDRRSRGGRAARAHRARSRASGRADGVRVDRRCSCGARHGWALREPDPLSRLSPWKIPQPSPVLKDRGDRAETAPINCSDRANGLYQLREVETNERHRSTGTPRRHDPSRLDRSRRSPRARCRMLPGGARRRRPPRYARLRAAASSWLVGGTPEPF